MTGRGASFPASFQLQVVALAFPALQIHHSGVCLCGHMDSPSVSVPKFPSSYKDTGYIRLGPTLIQCGLIGLQCGLLVASAKYLFPSKVTSIGTRG